MIYKYLIGALVIVAMGALIFYYRGNAIAATAEKERIRVELVAAVAVNQENQNTIKRLTEFGTIQDRVLGEVKTKIDAIRLATDLQSDQLKNLIGKSNEQLKACLDIALPDDFDKLFNPGNGNKNGTDSAKPVR